MNLAFWYLRHGETDWNARNLAQGSTDVPLNLDGVDQARRAATMLRHRGIAAVVCSPLVRAQTTAAIVAAALGLAPTIDEGLREASFGEREGQTMGDWFDRWVAGDATPEGGESFAQLRRRAVAAVDRALAGRGLTLLVGHGAVFRALRAEMGLPANVRLPNGAPLFCAPGEPWTLKAVG